MPTPDFILELRAMVGTHPLFLPGVTAFVLDERGFVLLGQRSDSRLWALPSGIPEPGEEMAGACVREVLEETGVIVEVQELIMVETIGPITYPNGDVSSYVDHFFRCRAVGGSAHVADDESLAVGWFPLDDLPGPASRRLPRLLEHAEQQAGTGRTRFTV